MQVGHPQPCRTHFDLACSTLLLLLVPSTLSHNVAFCRHMCPNCWEHAQPPDRDMQKYWRCSWSIPPGSPWTSSATAATRLRCALPFLSPSPPPPLTPDPYLPLSLPLFVSPGHRCRLQAIAKARNMHQCVDLLQAARWRHRHHLANQTHLPTGCL